MFICHFEVKCPDRSRKEYKGKVSEKIRLEIFIAVVKNDAILETHVFREVTEQNVSTDLKNKLGWVILEILQKVELTLWVRKKSY